jgi:hypothetical protein
LEESSAATAVVQRRGAFFVANTYPEAFDFCPREL